MKDLLLLLVHLLTAAGRLLGHGGAKALIAENLLIKHQLVILTRHRQRAPNPLPLDRFLLGFWSLFIRPGRIPKLALGLRPGNLLKFHQYLVRRKFRALFSSRKTRQPGPKGLSEQLIHAIVCGEGVGSGRNGTICYASALKTLHLA